MRTHKRVLVRRERFGLQWEAYGIAHKVVSFAKQTDIGIRKGDIVSKVIKGELKTIRVKDVYTYGKPPIKVYTFDLDGTEYIIEAKGFKKTEIREFNLQTILGQRPNVKWKGEWKVDEASLIYPVKPLRRH